MTGIFEVDKIALKKLNDEQARELVARLCKAECRTLGLAESAVTWGGDQRAPDGGVDVRVKLAGSPAGLDFIPKPSSAFQVKAETFPPSKIPNEVAPGGEERAIYGELAKEDGAYVIVSTRDDCSNSALKDRTEKIDETLISIGYGSALTTDFYCARRLADWVEKYPPIVTWIRNVLGEPIRGWRPYSAWAYREHDVNAEYLIDERVRVFVPGSEQGKDVALAIGMLRSDLQRPRSIRIVGLSGVGKTRLVQAIFDNRVLTDQPVPSADNVIYCDLADDPDPLPSAMIETLAEKGSDAVLVVDNCSPAEHSRLTEKALIPGRKIKLITIEYDIRDDVPESTSVYRLDGSSKGIIVELLKRHYPVLSNADAERIAEYSDGNARVAFALAGTAESAGDFASLRNSDLFGRLFHQKKKENDGLLRSAEVASLLYSFDGEDNEAGSELEILAGIAETSVQTFQRHMAELSRRGLLQKRRAWRAVLPHAIANQLATNALEGMDTSALVEALFVSATERVARSFSRRLGYLHNCPKAVDIARDLLSENGRLADVRALGDFQSQMFANLAPLDAEDALAGIERAQTDAAFVSTENSNRTNFIRIARSIAYDAELFEKAAEILVIFSIAESREYNREPARDALISLFHIILSGTQAPLEKRLHVARALLNSPEKKRQELGFETLIAGLKASHFSSHYSFEFGSRHRDYGWSPSTDSDVATWFTGWLDLARELLRAGDELSRRTRVIIGNAFRDLWQITQLQDQLIDLAGQLAGTESWPEGWLATKRIFRWDTEGQSKDSLAKLRKLEEALRPKDLLSEIRAHVLARDAFAEDLEDDGDDTASSPYQRARDHAERLGEAAAHDEAILDAAIAELLTQNSSDKAYSFGRGLGKTIDNPRMFISKIRAKVESSELGKISLIPIRGFISGWSEVDPSGVGKFLDEALEDKVWSSWFVELQVQGVIDDRAFERLLSAVREGKSPIWQFRYLAGGRATDPLSVRQIGELVNAINDQGQDGCFVAFDLLSMVIFGAKEKDENYRNELRQVGLEFLRLVDWNLVKPDHGSWDHDINVALKFVLSASNSKNEINEVLQNIIYSVRRDGRYISPNTSKILAVFFEYFPMMTLNAVYQPDEDGSYSSAYTMVSDDLFEHRQSALEKVPAEILVEWCDMSPVDRYPYAAATCRLFQEDRADADKLSISPTAITLLHHAPDKVPVVKEFISRFYPSSWSGSRASIVEKRLPLLPSFNPTNDQEIARVLANLERELREWILAERKREAKEERDDSGSFE